MSGPQLVECGDGLLLVEIDHIHDEVVLVNDPDRQVLLQVGHREVSYVERDNRGPIDVGSFELRDCGCLCAVNHFGLKN